MVNKKNKRIRKTNKHKNRNKSKCKTLKGGGTESPYVTAIPGNTNNNRRSDTLAAVASAVRRRTSSADAPAISARRRSLADPDMQHNAEDIQQVLAMQRARTSTEGFIVNPINPNLSSLTRQPSQRPALPPRQLSSRRTHF